MGSRYEDKVAQDWWHLSIEALRSLTRKPAGQANADHLVIKLYRRGPALRICQQNLIRVNPGNLPVMIMQRGPVIFCLQSVETCVCQATYRYKHNYQDSMYLL